MRVAEYQGPYGTKYLSSLGDAVVDVFVVGEGVMDYTAEVNKLVAECDSCSV